jgi:NTE family protein
VERIVEDVYANNDRLATYEFFDLGGRLDFGLNASRYAQFRLGYVFDQRKTRIDTGIPSLPQIDADDAGLEFSARYDSRDTATFATTGLAAALRFEKVDDSLGSDRNWERLEAGVRRSISVGKYVTWLSLAGGTDLDSDLPPDRYFSMGGSRVLPGYQHDELRVSDYWIAESSFLRRLKTLSPIKNQAIYAGLGLQAAGLYDRLDVEGEDDEVIYGGYLFLAGPTALGTFTLGMGFAEGEANVWLSVGKPIATGTILDDGLFR